MTPAVTRTGPTSSVPVLIGLWVFLVLIPGLFFIWMSSQLHEQWRFNEIHTRQNALERSVRRLLRLAHPSQDALEKLAAHPDFPSSPPPLSLSPQGREEHAVLSLLHQFLTDGQSLSQDSQLRICHHFGWVFNPYQVLEQPGVPVEITRAGQSAWLVWSAATATQPVRIALSAATNAFPRLSDLCSQQFRDTTREWLVIESTGGQATGVPSLRPLIPDLLALAKRQQNGRWQADEHVGISDMAQDGTTVFLRDQLSPRARLSFRSRLHAVLLTLLVIVSCVFPALCRTYLALPLFWKLLMLLGYLVVLPLAASGFLGQGFFHSRALNHAELLRTRALSDLEVFDSGFLHSIQSLESRFQVLKEALDRRRLSSAQVQKFLDPFFQAQVIDRFLLLSHRGDILLDRCSSRRNHSLMNEVGMAFCRDLFAQRRLGGRKVEEPKRFTLFNDLIQNSIWGSHYLVEGRLQRFLHGTGVLYSYWTLLAPQNPTFGLITLDLFHDGLVTRYLRTTPLRGASGRILACHLPSRTWFPGGAGVNDDLAALAEATVRHGKPQTAEIESSGQWHAALAIPAIYLKGCVLIALIPFSRQDSLLAITHAGWLSGLLLGLVLPLGFWMILAHGILQPIQNILAGINRLRRVELDRPIPSTGDDELGRLAVGVNRMMTVAADLDLARVVQRCFTPEQLPTVPGFTLHFWKSQRLGVGGAYFDCQTDAAGNLVLFFGSAVGQGIQAALIMAMVKSLSFTHLQAGGSADDLLPMIGQALPGLGVSRPAMCLTIISLQSASCLFKAWTAGSPAVLFKPYSNRSIVQFTSSSYPLGGRYRHLQEIAHQPFHPGDALLLMTHSVLTTAAATHPDDQLLQLTERFARYDPGAAESAFQNLRREWSTHAGGRESGKEAFCLLARTPSRNAEAPGCSEGDR